MVVLGLIVPVLVVCYGRLMRSEIVDFFKIVIA